MTWGAISADAGSRFAEGISGMPRYDKKQERRSAITGMTMAATSAAIARNVEIPWSSRMPDISLAYHEKPVPDADE